MTRHLAQHESEVPKMKTIGVVGGFGQWATLDILERIYRVAADRIPQYGNRGYPKTIIHVLNRAPMVLNQDGSYPINLEPSPEFIHAVKDVSGCSDFFIIPSNTPHLFLKEIERVAGKKILSIVDVTVEEVVRRGYKRIGLLAIGVTLDKRLYQDPLEAIGVQVISLPGELVEALEKEGIYPLQEGLPVHEIKPVAQQAIDYMRSQKVDGIILGCTEIPVLLKDAADNPDIINPSQLLAEATVKKSLCDVV